VKNFLISLCLILFFGACKIKKLSKNNEVIKEKHVQTNAEIEYKNAYFEAIKEKTLGNIEQASKYFSKCIQLNPTQSFAAKYELASIYSQIGRLPEASALAKEAYESDNSNEWYAGIYAQCLQREQHYNDASKVLEKNARLNKNKPDLLYNWANALTMAGKYKDALKVYDEVEKDLGINEEIIDQKQRIYLKLGELEKAAEEIKKLVELNPHEPRYLGMIADLYNVNGQHQKALEYFEKILTIDPENGFVHLSLADYYRTQGNKDKSITELKKAFTNSQVDIDTKMRILINYFEISEKDETQLPLANELLDLVIKSHPNEAKTYSIQGDFLYREKKIKESRDAFKKAIELDNSRFVIWNQLLLLNSELNDFEDLYNSGKQAIELFPNQPNLYLFTGLACMQKKLYKEAIEYLKSGVEFVVDNDPLKAQFYSYLGDCYHNLKDDEKSDNSYEQSLKIEPNNVYVLNNYSYYLSVRNKNLAKAEEMSKKAISIEPNVPNYEDTYAWILYKQSKYEDAKFWLEKAIANGGGGNATILEHLGDIYYKLNSIDKAIEFWNKAKLKGGSDLLEKKIKDSKLYE
jgi:tetratricopeptide (TPR) repeat protein